MFTAYTSDNPFELNDRVRIVGKRKIGIVATSKEDWEKSVKKALKDNAYEDFSDASIIIIYNEDSYDHNHVCPIYLEKVNTDEGLRTTR